MRATYSVKKQHVAARTKNIDVGAHLYTSLKSKVA